MSDFNHHVYLISYLDTQDGPIKFGYSHNPPNRLKQLQTGNPRQLFIYGNLGFKDENTARVVEKIILSYLKDNDVNVSGEWHNINVEMALQILQFFPDNAEKLFEPTEVKDGKIINFIDLINHSLEKNIINEDEYDQLRDIFWNDEEYQFTNLIEEIRKNK